MGLLDLFKKRKPVDLVALQRHLEIANDCAELIEHTVNPETFFNRYDLYIEKLTILADAQASRQIKVEGDDLVQKLQRMSSTEQKIDTINSFLDRMWSDTCEKASKLKTEKGKSNRFQKFLDTLSNYDDRMPTQCVEYYHDLFLNAPRTTSIKRNQLPANEIDRMQRIEASASYKNKIYNLFYKNYSEKPFISQDREINTDWLNQAEIFPEQSVIPKKMMSRFSDGLLPGHVYMLHWIDKVHRKRIPAYFEYEFGIEFEREKNFLIKNGYLNESGKLTEKGHKAVSVHNNVIKNKK
nr:hypothetical protein [uncultured Anaerostipes sp.]